MTFASLQFVTSLMDNLSIPYAFIEWKEKPPEDRYFVGEPIEDTMTTMEEDGRQDITFILRGYTRGQWELLAQDAQAIRNKLPHTAILEDGSGIAVYYGGSTFVPTGVAGLKSIKINLDIKEWSVK